MVTTYLRPEEVISLSVIDSDLKYIFYNIVQKNLWYCDMKQPNIYNKIPPHGVVYTGHKIVGNYDDLVRKIAAFIRKSQEEKLEKKTKSEHFGTTLQGIKGHGYIVAVIGDDAETIAFNNKPKFHKTEKSAKEEVLRLSTKFPGKYFAYFQAKGLAVSQINWV